MRRVLLSSPVAGATTAVTDWEARGTRVAAGDGEAFVLDTDPGGATGDRAGRPPLLVLHGFPSSSFDFRHVLPELGADRRVVLPDYLGFGLSTKPDRRYGIRTYADEVEAVVVAVGLAGATVDLLTHDLGDSVGGELLARSLDGSLGFEVGRRVITNGSIYMDLVQLSVGQQFLLALPDERADFGGADGFGNGLGGTFSPAHPASPEELEAQWLLASRADGHTLLPRTIRYIEDRRVEEHRYTGAIERHRSPLAIVWGEVDPIAVHPMALRLAERVPAAPLTTLDGVGHYPMVEDPARFAAAVLAGLEP